MAKLLGMFGCLVAIGVLVGAASADPDEVTKRAKIDFEVFFKKLDTNKDGKLSREEFLKMVDRAKDKDKVRDKLGKVYDKLDPDKRGISKEQFKTYLEMRKKDEK